MPEEDDENLIPLDDDFDAGEYFPTLADTYAEVLGEAAGGRPRPGYVEQFAGVIRSASCSTSAPGDFVDARYYVDRAIPQGVSGSRAAPAILTAQTDLLPGVRQCLTAVNLAELPFGTHLLPAGTLVQVFVLYDRSAPQKKWYLFNQPLAGAVAVQITGSAGGSGQYNGRILSGAARTSPTASLGMPAGMTIPGSDNALVLNVEEDGQTGHRLRTATYAAGLVVGKTDESTPRPIVMVRGGVGETASPTTLGGTTGGSETADTATWSRTSSATPLNLFMLSRVVYNPTGDKTLYAFVRQISFDARGLLLSVAPKPASPSTPRSPAHDRRTPVSIFSSPPRFLHRMAHQPSQARRIRQPDPQRRRQPRERLRSGSSTCPGVCLSCPNRYPLTVAGVGGPGPACCIPALNGTFTLLRIANNCQWATGVHFQPGGCTFGWEMFCSLVDCNNVAGPMRWVIAMYGSIGYLWAEKISSAVCPPTGVYKICSNLCSGGAAASVVLG